MIEKILCAAIHFKDGQKHKGMPRNITEGFVICGYSHESALQVAELLTSEPKTGLFELLTEDCEAGFLTSYNRFVNRKEGAYIAFDAGQIQTEQLTLISEQLYQP